MYPKHTKGFGVIGVGTWGKLHARVYSHLSGGRLIAVCDADQQCPHRLAAACEGPRDYTARTVGFALRICWIEI
ncbi:MAG: hypothetical protein ITD46_02620 [Nitrosospira sp.]|nr:hypothetical protein [Nitrosospira sp.]